MNRTIHVPDDLDARVEEARGDVPRSKFWVRAMERALEGSEPAGRQTPVRTDPASSRSSDRPPKAAEIARTLNAGSKAGVMSAAALARQQKLNRGKGM